MAYEITPSDELIFIRAFGIITLDDLIGIGRDVDLIENARAIAPDRLLDLSQSSGDMINFAAIESFSTKRALKVLKNKVRLAVVAPDDLQFGVARMFQSLVANPQIDLQIFRKRELAWTWLSTDSHSRRAQ
jgi:hypothetical protein